MNEIALSIFMRVMYYVSDVFATGGRDSLILVWDARCRATENGISNKPENAIKNIKN